MLGFLLLYGCVLVLMCVFLRVCVCAWFLVEMVLSFQPEFWGPEIFSFYYSSFRSVCLARACVVGSFTNGFLVN